MARGRKAAPAQSKVLAGNFRSDRDSHGAPAPIGVPACPTWLPAAAKKHWRTLGPQLAECGLLSLIDGDVLALHCDSVAKYAEVTRQLQSIEDAMAPTPQGFMVQSVMFTVRNKLHDQIVKTAREFGGTPSARSGIRTGAQTQLDLGDWGDL